MKNFRCICILMGWTCRDESYLCTHLCAFDPQGYINHHKPNQLVLKPNLWWVNVLEWDVCSVSSESIPSARGTFNVKAQQFYSDSLKTKFTQKWYNYLFCLPEPSLYHVLLPNFRQHFSISKNYPFKPSSPYLWTLSYFLFLYFSSFVSRFRQIFRKLLGSLHPQPNFNETIKS